MSESITLRVNALKMQCEGANSAQCTCALQRKLLRSQKGNSRSEAAGISVTLTDQDSYMIRRRLGVFLVARIQFLEAKSATVTESGLENCCSKSWPRNLT
jgi:hypothetical protein